MGSSQRLAHCYSASVQSHCDTHGVNPRVQSALSLRCGAGAVGKVMRFGAVRFDKHNFWIGVVWEISLASLGVGWIRCGLRPILRL